MAYEIDKLKQILEAALMAVGEPLTINRLGELFDEAERPEKQDIKAALEALAEDYNERSLELRELGNGFCFRVRQDFAPWVSKLWEERPPRYTRALLETLALIAYRQPITRGEIEKVRGVAVSTHTVKTLMDRNWIKVVGHRDVPGKPSLYATTKDFLDYFSLKSLTELPPLAEIQDLDKAGDQLQLSLADVVSGDVKVEIDEQAEKEADQQHEITESILEVEFAASDDDLSVNDNEANDSQDFEEIEFSEYVSDATESKQ